MLHIVPDHNISLSHLLSLLASLHGFLLFTVIPNTFMIIGGKLLGFFLSVSILRFSLSNPGALT